MRMQMMWIRTLTATVLFLILAQVNVWADTQTHLVLAVGYRAFLLCAPLFMIFGLSTAMRASIGLCLVAVAVSLYSVNALAMCLLAVGMAVSGYLAKYISAHTSQGAADNKVSLNLGSLVSGLLLLSAASQTTLLTVCAALLIATLGLAFRVDWKQFNVSGNDSGRIDTKSKKMEIGPVIGWSLIGIATGIKLTGIFAILPQYLIAQLGVLPRWFGALVILNSLIVVLAQHQVMKVLDRSRSQATFITALSAMALLALPGLMRAEHPLIATTWIVLLTLGECALSRYDRTAKEAGYLFPKELMVGIGSFATVWLSRTFPHQIHLSGVLGCACLILGTVILSLRVKPVNVRRDVLATSSA